MNSLTKTNDAASAAPKSGDGRLLTRVGVVGVGYLGKFHAEKYARMQNVKLVGVVDTNRQQCAAIAQQHGTQAYADHRDLIGKVDAVSIAAPTQAHFEISRDFLANNVDLLIEKPITARLEEADQLIALARQHACLIQVGHLERFNPALVAVNGIVKAPKFIEAHRLSIFKERGTDVSVVLDLMIHDIDIILNFVKSDVTSIHAAGLSVITEHVDIANARLTFANGCVANLTASRVSMKNERKMRLFQQDAYIAVDFAKHKITIVKPDPQAQASVIPNMAIGQSCFTKTDALDDELKAFIVAVNTHQAPQVTGQMGRDALQIALKLMKQIDQTSAHMTGA